MCFTKKDTRAIKGFSILLMLMHHLLFITRQPQDLLLTTDISINGVNLIYLAAIYSKICVGLFTVLGGYGLYCTLSKTEDNSVYVLPIKYKSLYRSFWKIFLIYVPIGFLFFNNQPVYCTETDISQVFRVFDRIECTTNFLGLTHTYNFEWWYFKFFLIAVLVGTFFFHLFFNRTENFYIDSTIVLITTLLLHFIPRIISLLFPDVVEFKIFQLISNENALFLPVFLWGMVFSKYDLLAKARFAFVRFSLPLRFLVGLILSFICVVLKVYYFTDYEYEMEAMLSFIQIVAVLLMFDSISFIWKFLQMIGKYSTNMWLIHTFYCYYFGSVARIVYYSKNFVIDYLTLFLLTFISAIAVDRFWKGLETGVVRLKQKIMKNSCTE